MLGKIACQCVSNSFVIIDDQDRAQSGTARNGVQLLGSRLRLLGSAGAILRQVIRSFAAKTTNHEMHLRLGNVQGLGLFCCRRDEVARHSLLSVVIT